MCTTSQYENIIADSLQCLHEVISIKMQFGWQPCGGIAIDTTQDKSIYIQSLIRTIRQEDAKLEEKIRDQVGVIRTDHDCIYTKALLEKETEFLKVFDKHVRDNNM